MKDLLMEDNNKDVVRLKLNELARLDPHLFKKDVKVFFTDSEIIAGRLLAARADESHPMFGALVVLVDMTPDKSNKELM